MEKRRILFFSTIVAITVMLVLILSFQTRKNLSEFRDFDFYIDESVFGERLPAQGDYLKEIITEEELRQIIEENPERSKELAEKIKENPEQGEKLLKDFLEEIK